MAPFAKSTAVPTSAADLEWSRGQSSDSDGAESQSAAGGWGRVARTLALGSIGVVAITIGVCGHASRASMHATDGAKTIGLSDEGTQSAKLALAAAGAVGKNAAANASVVPFENKNDGNPCADDEEYFEGVCYSKCSLLTQGKYGYRHSAWTCCSKENCGPNPFKALSCCVHHIGLCSGFDVAGAEEGKEICPHQPGVCLADEELFLNLCYAKCSLLTNGAYPYRKGAESCCQSNSALGCMAAEGAKDGLNGQAITDAKFAVGGGCGDKTPGTECQPHAPSVQLTES